MKKYTYLTTALALIGASAVAQAKEGFYGNIGIDGGWMFGRTTSDLTVPNTAAGSQTFSTKLGPVGGSFGATLGGAYLTDSNVIVGVDLTGAWGTSKAKADDSSQPYTITSFKQEDTYGIHAVVGYAYTVVQPYMRLGWSHAKFRGTSDSQPSGVGVTRGNAVHNHWESGFALTFGADFCITEGLFIGGYMAHTWYGDFKFNTDGDAPVSYKMTPESDEFRVRLKYMF